MHRLTVALLAAFDAAIAVAVGLVVVLAPLTVLWVLGFGGAPEWSALWPASAAIWQLGNLVPLAIELPGEYLAATGIGVDASSFVLSLAPLAFAGFTAVFAARSGVRASRAEAWIIGVVTGVAVFGGLTAAVAVTSGNEIARVETWQAIVLPTAVFAVPVLIGAVVTEWREAGSGVVAALRDRVEASPNGWGQAPALVARGSAVVVTGLLGFGALLTAVAIFAGGGEIIALFEAGHVDALGATIVTLGQLAYLPTLVVWAIAFLAGPGFALGEGTSISPAGTQVGVVPGIPLLGALPESTTPWLLLLALAPVALGAFAGWIARSRLLGAGAPAVSVPVASRGEEGDAAPAADPDHSADPDDTDTRDLADDVHAARAALQFEVEPVAARLTIAVGIAVVAAAASALLCLTASGSLGPGTLAHVGPEPGPVALAVGLEVFVGAAILLMSPLPRRTRAAAGTTTSATGGTAAAASKTTDRAPVD